MTGPRDAEVASARAAGVRDLLADLSFTRAGTGPDGSLMAAPLGVAVQNSWQSPTRRASCSTVSERSGPTITRCAGVVRRSIAEPLSHVEVRSTSGTRQPRAASRHG